MYLSLSVYIYTYTYINMCKHICNERDKYEEPLLAEQARYDEQVQQNGGRTNGVAPINPDVQAKADATGLMVSVLEAKSTTTADFKGKAEYNTLPPANVGKSASVHI